MADRKYKMFLNVILSVIIIAIIAVVIYIVYEYVYMKNKIDANASDILDAFDKYMNTINSDSTNEFTDGTVSQENISSQQNQISNINNSTTNYNTVTGYALTYRGYGVLGKIELPKVGLKYPILEMMTNANAIDISVAVQYGVRIKQNRKYCYNWT